MSSWLLLWWHHKRVLRQRLFSESFFVDKKMDTSFSEKDIMTRMTALFFSKENEDFITKEKVCWCQFEKRKSVIIISSSSSSLQVNKDHRVLFIYSKWHEKFQERNKREERDSRMSNRHGNDNHFESVSLIFHASRVKEEGKGDREQFWEQFIVIDCLLKHLFHN